MNTATVQEDTSRQRLRGLVLVAVVAAMLVCLVALYWIQDRRERTAIADLPEAERAEFYERTLKTLQTTCAAGSEGLKAYCAEQAQLIQQFPECDEACRELALKHTRRVER